MDRPRPDSPYPFLKSETEQSPPLFPSSFPQNNSTNQASSTTLSQTEVRGCFFCKKGDHTTQECRGSARPPLRYEHHPRSSASANREITPSIRQEIEQNLPTCFKCKQSGHIARNCPTNLAGLLDRYQICINPRSQSELSNINQFLTNMANLNDARDPVQPTQYGPIGSVHQPRYQNYEPIPPVQAQASQYPEVSNLQESAPSRWIDQRDEMIRLRDGLAGVNFTMSEHVDVLSQHSANLDTIVELVLHLKQRIVVLETQAKDKNNQDIVQLPTPSTYDGSLDDQACYKWILQMKTYIRALKALDRDLTDYQQVTLIAAYLRGSALQYWITFTTNNSTPPCDQCHAGQTHCHGGDAETSKCCSPCRFIQGPGAVCTYKHIALGFPRNAVEAFKLIEKRYSPALEEYLVDWAKIGAVEKWDEICQQWFNTTLPHPHRQALKERFFNSIKPDIRQVMLQKLHFDKHLMDHSMSYQELVKMTIAAERILFHQRAIKAAEAQNQPQNQIQPEQQIRPSAPATYSQAVSRSAASQSVRSTPRAQVFNNSANHPPTGPRYIDPRAQNFARGGRMPKKGTAEWIQYCRMRSACFECGQLTHTSRECVNVPPRGSVATGSAVASVSVSAPVSVVESKVASGAGSVGSESGEVEEGSVADGESGDAGVLLVAPVPETEIDLIGLDDVE